MALSQNKTAEVAQACYGVSNELNAVLAKVRHLLAVNSDLSIDWAAGSTPAYISEDGNGNITGFAFSRTDVANFIGSIDQIRKAFDNEQVTQGDHLGNISKLTNPSLVR